MVITMVTVRVMQVTIDQIIDVITVRYRFVTASGTVHVARVVAAAVVLGGASDGIGLGDFDRVLFDFSVFQDVMQVAVVQVIHVVAVLDTGVFAIWAVLVVVMGVQIRHLSRIVRR